MTELFTVSLLSRCQSTSWNIAASRPTHTPPKISLYVFLAHRGLYIGLPDLANKYTGCLELKLGHTSTLKKIIHCLSEILIELVPIIHPPINH